jgi:hypothetical protein
MVAAAAGGGEMLRLRPILVEMAVLEEVEDYLLQTLLLVGLVIHLPPLLHKAMLVLLVLLAPIPVPEVVAVL